MNTETNMQAIRSGDFMRTFFALTKNAASPAHHIPFLLILLTALVMHAPAHSQQADHAAVQTEQPKTKKHIGDATTSILETQANGSMAGGSLPILGPTATLSWQRYLESYKHPIPETFTRKLDEIGQR